MDHSVTPVRIPEWSHCWCTVALLLHMDLAVGSFRPSQQRLSHSFPSAASLFLDLVEDTSAAAQSARVSAG